MCIANIHSILWQTIRVSRYILYANVAETNNLARNYAAIFLMASMVILSYT